jgi:hypothetical protein
MQFPRQGARAALMLLVAMTMCVCAGVAQEFRGTISGAVTDPTGAEVPGASVVVKETHTGTTNTTKSDAAGQYVLPFLLPGDYTITVTMPGFQTVTRNGITLQTQEHPIVNLTLPVGETSQTVTVTDSAPLIDQANASVGQVISTQSVEDLPLNGRTPTTFTELSEGVITTAAPELIHPFDNGAGNSWSIGGTPNQVSEVLLDGSPDLTMLGALAYAPTQDSVQEVSVRPFDTDASFGHTIGGVINQITRGGTNGYHGTLYDFYQTAGLDANLYFNKRANPVQSRPNAHYQQYGGTFGGPISIPKVYNGKDKLFYFFAYEGLKDSTPATTTLTVPTAAERTGDFSQTLAAGCPTGFNNNPATAAAVCNADAAIGFAAPYADPYQLYNPYTAVGTTSSFTRSPYLSNQVVAPGGTFNPVALAYLNLFPQPNNSAGVAADGQGNYVSGAPSIDTYDNEFGRVDYNVSSRDHLFVDFRHNHRTQLKNDYFGTGVTGSTLVRANFGLTIDNVYTLNPSTIFDTRVNWTYFNEVFGTPAQKYSPGSVGLPATLTTSAEEVQLPYINFGTGSSCGSETSYQCFGDTGSGFDPTTSYQVFTDVVKVIGRHTLKVGFDGRQYRMSVQHFLNSSGNFTFNSAYTNAGTSGNNNIFGGDLAAFMLGLPSTGDYDLEARADYTQFYIGSFLQDDWRVNDKLTLNLGLRFDIDTPFGEKYGRTVSGFNPTAANAVSPLAASFTGATVSSSGVSATLPSISALGGLTFPNRNGGSPYQTNSGFLSPRFGFSYSATPKLVMRGGFGIFVQPETLSTLASTGTYSTTAISNQEGFSASTAYAGQTTTSYFTPPTDTLSNPYPNGFNQPVGSSQGASTFLGQAITFLAPVEHDPYSERWDFGAQYSLTNSTLLEALYVGNHSLHLPVASQNLNTVLPQYATTNPYRNEALSLAYSTNVTNPFAGQLPNSSGCNGATTAFSNLVVANPQFCTATINEENETVGQSYFNSVILHVEQRAKHGLTLTANYSFSRLLEADTRLNDQYNTLNERISPFDHTHHFTVGGTYELPFGKGKEFAMGGSRLMDELLGGFVVNAIYQFQSGPPVEFPTDIPLQPGVSIRDITNKTRDTAAVGSGNPALSISKFVTGSATTCPTTGPCDGSTFINGQYVDHIRTLPTTMSWVRGDGFNNMDASLLKNFNFTKGTYFQLRFETFNTFNHAVFATPNVSSATASNFGYITAVAANSQPRQVQLGGRFVF